MGRWLSTNGEAIYESHPWLYQNDTTTPNVWYTSSPSPTTQRLNVFAVVLDYPYDSNSVELYSLFEHIDESTTVHMLGYSDALDVGFRLNRRRID